MSAAWPTVVQTRTDRDGTTFQLTHEGRIVRVRFHSDGTIRLAAHTEGRWLFEPSGRPVPREHGYPVVRVRPEPPSR